MQSLSPSVASPIIYLMMGCPPAIMDRDIQIMRLVGQTAISSRDIQDVSDIIHHHLTKYEINFPGWSGVARRTAAIYGIYDPLEIMEQPWRSDRFSSYAKDIITKYWTEILKESADSYESLNLLDKSRLNLESPHPIWTYAGSDAVNIQRTAIVSWFLLGTYKTNLKLFEMRKTYSPNCVLCNSSLPVIEDRKHFALSCAAFADIREIYLGRFISLCPFLIKYMDISDSFLTILLDPMSPRVPLEIREGWTDLYKVYSVSRDFFHALHKKRNKLVDNFDTNSHNTPEDKLDIVVSLYSKINYPSVNQFD